MLFRSRHSHREICLEWYETLERDQMGLCRVVQLAVMRLLGTKAVMGADAIPASEALRAVEELLEDERGDFVVEPEGLDIEFRRLLRRQHPTPKMINDAYLAAFAIASGRRLVTRDRGFLEFRGLDVELLA